MIISDLQRVSSTQYELKVRGKGLVESALDPKGITMQKYCSEVFLHKPQMKMFINDFPIDFRDQDVAVYLFSWNLKTVPSKQKSAMTSKVYFWGKQKVSQQSIFTEWAGRLGDTSRKKPLSYRVTSRFPPTTRSTCWEQKSKMGIFSRCNWRPFVTNYVSAVTKGVVQYQYMIYRMQLCELHLEYNSVYLSSSYIFLSQSSQKIEIINNFKS